MAKYRAKLDLLIGSQVVKAGTEFTSSLVPGKNWYPIDAAAKAAVAAQFGAAAVDESRAHDFWHSNFRAVR